MTEPDHTPGPMDALIADFRVTRNRLRDSPPTTIKAMVEELRNNVYPSMIALAEQIAEVDEVVLEMSEQGDSFIQPELAAQFFSTIAIGAQVLEEARNFLPEMSDLARKRVKDLLDNFEQSMELTFMGISEATVDPGDEEEEEEEGEDTDKESEGDEPENIPVDLPVAAESTDESTAS